jgi:hypothetical protein
VSEPNPDATEGVGGEASELPRCGCGTDRASKFSVVHRQYGFFGTLYLLWGGTAVPTRVSFRCVKCGAQFDASTRPSVCRQYIT